MNEYDYITPYQRTDAFSKTLEQLNEITKYHEDGCECAYCGRKQCLEAWSKGK